jgi:phosphotransferase system enzyme I (PtsI)
MRNWYRMRNSRLRTTTFPGSRIADEKARFDAAVVTARAELASLGAHIPAGAPAEFEAFLNVHLMMLDDPTLSDTPKQLIESLQCNAEWALKLQMDALIDQFESIEDGYLRDRKTDVIQVVERVLKVLMGRPGQVLARNAPEENSILVAHDLSPPTSSSSRATALQASSPILGARPRTPQSSRAA